ncbi:MAG: TlpA family protein disulfide reductase [Candidatus Heimdallarchaeota archaeon]|nr:TlpA family protein disulfide reductase [Candidatus Heimdallarchaeota archaeon]
MRFLKLLFLVLLIQPASAYEINYSFTDLDNKDIPYSHYEGSYLFIEAIWTECRPCITYHTTVISLYETYKEDLQFLTVAVFNGSDTVDTARDFQTEYGGSWAFGLDQGWLRLQYEFESVPTTLILDSQGNLLQSWVGFQEENVISYWIEFNIRDNTDATPPSTYTFVYDDPYFPPFRNIMRWLVIIAILSFTIKKFLPKS